jgi:hypothetical protein
VGKCIHMKDEHTLQISEIICSKPRGYLFWELATIFMEDTGLKETLHVYNLILHLKIILMYYLFGKIKALKVIQDCLKEITFLRRVYVKIDFSAFQLLAQIIIS